MAYSTTTRSTTTTWTEIQPNPNPNPNPPPSSSIDPFYSSSSSSLTHPQNPTNDNNNNTVSSVYPVHQYYSDATATLMPPGVDSYSYPPYGHALSYDASSGYYLDPNTQNWAAKLAVRQYGSDPAASAGAVSITIPPNGIEQLAIAYPSSAVQTNFTFQPHGNGNWKKHEKKTKVVQSAYCEICKVDCNSKDVLDKHKLGKKHKKNLEKMQQAAAAGPSALARPSNPVIGPQLNLDKLKPSNMLRNRKKAAEPVEDLETKRRKIVAGGAAVEAVRTCQICNVVCNSETVFSHHLAGQKHAAMVKKRAARIGVATVL